MPPQISKERIRELRIKFAKKKTDSALLIQRRARLQLRLRAREKAVKLIQQRLRNFNTRRGSISIEITTKDSIWKEIKRLRSSGAKEARMSLVEDGDIITTFIIDFTKKNSDVYEGLFYDLDYGNIFDQYPNAKLILTRNTKMKPQRIAQAFKQGTTNCLFQPIINWCEDKLESVGTERTEIRYTQKLNLARKLEEKYRESGVEQTELQSIADKLQINITIKLPFDQDLYETKCNKKALRTFSFINTKLNHVDHNEIVNTSQFSELSFEELSELYENMIQSGDYFIFKRNLTGITWISSLTGVYALRQDFNEFVNNFKKKTGLNSCYICDYFQKDLSQYVRASCNSNLTINFFETDPEEDCPTLNLESSATDGEFNHMDMEKAYKNVHQCKYYSGYVGKITDFRKTNKIVGVGIYTITNLKLPEILDRYNVIMKIWNNGNPYPSPELQFLTDSGATFDITEGCWGMPIKFTFEEDEWLNRIDDYRKGGGPRWYAKFVGCMECNSSDTSFYMNGESNYIQNLTSYLPEECYTTFNDEIKFILKSERNNHLTHIASFIKSYTRINMMQQLMTMQPENIIRVCVDGIYYTGPKVKLSGIFRDDPKEIKQNCSCPEYCSNYYHEYTWKCDANYKPFHKTELDTGEAGTGKSETHCKDDGLIKTCYFAPSWKLARKKQSEYTMKVDVIYKLTCSDPEVYKKVITNNNVLIIDEVSMLSNENKELILKRFSGLKIIMCGDVGFQLPCIQGEGSEFKLTGFEYHKEYLINYRVQDEVLLILLRKIRDMIKAVSPVGLIKQFVIKNFNHSTVEDYNVGDMILCRTNKRKELFTEKFKHLEKYYITETTRNYSNGQITLFKPEGVKCELRHGYTVHSIQGETAEHNLYIDIEDFHSATMIYTALSRARTYSQIKLIT